MLIFFPHITKRFFIRLILHHYLNEEKCFLIGIICNYKYNLFKSWVESDIQNMDYQPFMWGHRTLKEFGCNATLLMDLKSMSLLFSKSKLNSKTMNGMKAEMMSLLRLVNEIPQSKNLLNLYLRKFSSIAKGIKDSDNDYKKDIYVKLEAYIGFVKDYAYEEGVNAEVIEEIKNTLLLFPLKDKFATELNEKGFVSDDLIS